MLDDLSAAHAQRLREIDSLLRPPGPLVSTADNPVITVTAGSTHAAGLGHTTLTDPREFRSCFTALRHYSLDIRVAGPDPAAALDKLLSAWSAQIADDDPAQIETAAGITWPSRDTAAAPALVRHGFAPSSVLAVHTRVVPDPEPDPKLTIRDAGPGDLEAVLALQMTELRYDAQFGACIIRENTKDALRELLQTALAPRNGTRVLALHGTEPVGLAIVDLPPETEWLSSLVDASRVGYVQCLAVRADVRCQGIGRRLVQAAHRRLGDAAVDAIALHHVVANPHATPFWHNQGYRPLWINWINRPGATMFPSSP